VFYCAIKSELSEITPATARGRVGWGRGRGGQHAEWTRNTKFSGSILVLTARWSCFKVYPCYNVTNTFQLTLYFTCFRNNVEKCTDNFPSSKKVKLKMRFLKMILPLHQRDFKDRKGTTKFNYWQLWKPKVLAFDYYVGNLIIVAFFWLPQSEAGILILRCFAKLRNLKTNVFFAAFLQFIFASILCFSFPENCFLMQIKPITDCREIRKWPYGKHSSLAGETEKWKLWRDK